MFYKVAPSNRSAWLSGVFDSQQGLRFTPKSGEEKGTSQFRAGAVHHKPRPTLTGEPYRSCIPGVRGDLQADIHHLPVFSRREGTPLGMSAGSLGKSMDNLIRSTDAVRFEDNTYLRASTAPPFIRSPKHKQPAMSLYSHDWHLKPPMMGMSEIIKAIHSGRIG